MCLLSTHGEACVGFFQFSTRAWLHDYLIVIEKWDLIDYFSQWHLIKVKVTSQDFRQTRSSLCVYSFRISANRFRLPFIKGKPWPKLGEMHESPSPFLLFAKQRINGVLIQAASLHDANIVFSTVFNIPSRPSL